MPFGVKLLWSVRLKTPGAARPPSYTWISSACADAARGTATAVTKIAAARMRIFGADCNPVAILCSPEDGMTRTQTFVAAVVVLTLVGRPRAQDNPQATSGSWRPTIV